MSYERQRADAKVLGEFDLGAQSLLCDLSCVQGTAINTYIRIYVYGTILENWEQLPKNGFDGGARTFLAAI